MHTKQNWRYTVSGKMYYLYLTVLYQGIFSPGSHFQVVCYVPIFQAWLCPQDENFQPSDPLPPKTFHLLTSLLLPRSWLSGSMGLVTNNTKKAH